MREAAAPAPPNAAGLGVSAREAPRTPSIAPDCRSGGVPRFPRAPCLLMKRVTSDAATPATPVPAGPGPCSAPCRRCPRRPSWHLDDRHGGRHDVLCVHGKALSRRLAARRPTMSLTEAGKRPPRRAGDPRSVHSFPAARWSARSIIAALDTLTRIPRTPWVATHSRGVARSSWVPAPGHAIALLGSPFVDPPSRVATSAAKTRPALTGRR